MEQNPLFRYVKERKNMTTLEKKVEELVKPIIENLGYSVYDVMYQKEGKDNYLRIFIDSQKGIGLNDCELVNNSITDILDEKDYIKAQYYLEISSPGLERNLRRDEQFLDNINKKIEVHLYNSINNNKTVTGILKEYNENNIVIDDIKIEKSNITSAKTIYNWEEC